MHAHGKSNHVVECVLVLFICAGMPGMMSPAVADVFNIGPGLTSLDFVTVGNPGNAGELTAFDEDHPGRICGGVDYTYKIGKYEVTAGQYCEFLNAVAKTDNYGLYNTYMWGSDGGCKIQQGGSPGSYTYSVDPNLANRPVNCIDWGDAARFCNWLANGQPTGEQNSATTEDGSYYINGAVGYEEPLTVRRKSCARYVVPSEDEWYKAAYHKNDGVTGNYWDYPTQSDTEPIYEPPPGRSEPPGSFNRYNEYPLWTTEAGVYRFSPSPYGTFDQGGNLLEYTDTILGDIFPYRCVRELKSDESGGPS